MNEGKMISALMFVTFFHLAVKAQKATYLITAPNVVHLGVEETVSVQLHDANHEISVTLFFKHHGTDLSEKQTVSLNEQNQYQAVVKLRVDPDLYSKLNPKPKYVQLAAESTAILPKQRAVNIYLSTKRGYLFIQTDKSIYNPGEKVNYRIFTLNNYMLPIDDLIQVQIFNCKDMLVYSGVLKSEQILQKSISIPDIELPGRWKITASFYHFEKSNTSVQFEVREYVLPSFEVKLKAPKLFLTLNSLSFQVSLSARYTYMKEVDGVAYIRYGLIDSNGNRTYLPGTEQQTAVNNGHADITILVSDLRSAAANQSLENLEGLNLYIAASVLEKASGDLQEAEISSVKIVNSPYVIDLSRTKQFFTPGGQFSILATTTFPHGSRVPNLKINANIIIDPQNIVLTKESQGDSMGNVIITFNVPVEAKSLLITVHAEGNDGEVIISDAKMKATAIKDEEGSYLSLEVQHQILQPGQKLHVTFRDIVQLESVKPSYIYYLVVSKGQILQANSVHRTDLTSVDIPFSPDMVPSFRLVAYYYTKNDNLVADSLWVDVKDVCKGKVEVSSFKELQPAQPFELSIKTDAGSKVAMSAVDSAVFILNNRDKISPQRMFDYMNSYDLACSVGGGENSLSVLESAGLTYISTSHKSPILTSHKCNKDNQRHKRDLSALVNKYKQPERRCCEDGKKLGLMQQSCDERLKRTSHQTSSCREAFKRCCEAATLHRKKAMMQRRRSSLGRSLAFGGDVEETIDESSIQLRSYFPQSWMWMILDADASGNIRKNLIAPDSITTWEVQTVSISQSKGFCIADPVPLKVFQDFFISLKLPYSVKRNEQLQVKVILYNYKQQSLQVTVKMEKVEGLCSAGGGDVVQQVSIEGHSALSVYFTVIPLVIGNIPISVLAYASNSINDKIKKDLKVVGEGEIVSIHTDHNIAAKSEKLEFDITLPDDAVPGQDSTTMMSFRGGVMGESAANCLNLEGVNNLIKLPTGCAEQTMVKMSPAIHAIHYLDATDQWISLKAERRDEAKEMIQEGYNRVLLYKKDDGSYGTFLKTPSSNWLTAFIAKELTKSKDIIKVNEQYILEAMSYLISKQKANGAWDDPNPLYDQGMKGGVGKVDEEEDVPLTAFILLSMKNAMKMYTLGTDTELRVAKEKARVYLVQHLSSLQSPYATAITAYALSLNEQHTTEAIEAQRKLMDMATCDNKQCFWNVSMNVKAAHKQADAVSVEATAYGLLEAVIMQDKSYARRIASWLTEQRKFGGGFQSTQDTVVALEALSKLAIQNNDVDDLDLTVDVCVNDGDTKTVRINKRNALTQTAIQVKGLNKVVLDVKGEGRGTVSIVQNYRSLKKDDSACDHFFLSVTLEGELKPFSNDEEAEQLDDDDYYNYNYEDGPVMEEAPDRMHWFDLRTRRKRTAPEQNLRENTLFYTVCVGVKNGNSSGMILVDLSLLSGLKPKIQDLEDNVKGTERYIDHYDVYQNKVYLYFHKILFGENACLRFRAEQIVPIGLVQPAAAVVYDYYRPDRRCSMFYTVADGPMLFKLCEEDVCVCAESGCPKLKGTFSKNMDDNTRTRYACFSPTVDFFYTIRILNISDDNVFKTYTTIITQVLQPGKDAVVQDGAVREMLHRSSCDVNLNVETEYLIMGQDENIYEVTAQGRSRYMLDNKIWIEEIPPERKCRATKSKAACQRLSNFLLQYSLNQCSI